MVKLFIQYTAYTLIKINYCLKRYLSKNIENYYLFILTPPYSGSTILHTFLSSSKNISINNPFGTREGQTLPSVRKMMWESQRWNEKVEFDWEYIKSKWIAYWDVTKPLLLEKSPANILRADSIEKTFIPSYFLIMVRNPYAHVQSLISRNKSTATNAAKFVIKCLQFQKNNNEKLKKSLFFTYEELCDNTNQIKFRIEKFMPEIGTLNIKKAHNFRRKKLVFNNNNSKKIKLLTNDQIIEINSVFSKHVDLLNYFNYELISG